MGILAGKAALVSGASREIGATVAESLADERALHCSRAVVPGIAEKSGGRIVITLTNPINNPVVAHHDYTTANSAFLGFSRNLGPSNITVNMIAGGLSDETDASAPTTEEVRDIVASSTPLRRLGEPEDIGRAVLMFASPWSDSPPASTSPATAAW